MFTIDTYNLHPITIRNLKMVLLYCISFNNTITFETLGIVLIFTQSITQNDWTKVNQQD